MAKANKKVVVDSPDALVSYTEGQHVIDPAEAAANSGDYQGEEVVEMRTSDTSEFAARIADLEAQLAIAQANAKKAPRTAKSKKSAEEIAADREAKRVELEAARAAKQVEYEAELVSRAERIQSELLAYLSEPVTLEKLNELLQTYSAQARIAKPSKKTASTVTSEGSTIAVNGVVYKNKMYWKETHHLSDEEVLAIVAEAKAQEAIGKVNKSAIGRMFNAHPAMIGNILDGSYYSEVTGIPKPAKKG